VEDPLKSECIAELSGHTKRLGHCEWHPTADNILLSVAYDLKVSSSNSVTSTCRTMS